MSLAAFEEHNSDAFLLGEEYLLHVALMQKWR